ncbi:hypothetical protein MSAN_00040800 [Mycena sanguinolenta]|uniref:Uncharacterized protein n=1 Tax=Mycena sanguinolenta TaxID=230812 RepID=A0A8H7DJ76_9AGAR|nr:hypothetical protein MSAN_00040800 [Mycena sanguinolenta]
MAPGRRKWSREALLRNLQLIGELIKRKAPTAPPEPNKRPRTDPDRLVEEGELPEEPPLAAGPSTASVTAPSPVTASAAGPAPTPPPPIASLPLRRPRAGKVSLRQCEALHTKYHRAGRMLKYSGDARFWSTYPPSHKEYRALANPPPPNSPYYKHGGLIARLELLDALVCFTYSIWNRDYPRRYCSRETWYTIEAFLVWCKQKWQAEEGTPDAEKAFLGLILMIEGFIHSRKLVYGAMRGSPVERDLEKLVGTSRAAIAAAATEAAVSSAASLASLAPNKSSPTPGMLPSPASLVPSANSTPTNRDGTPSSISSTTAPPSCPPRPWLPPHISSAMENVTIPVAPRLINELKNETMGIQAAAYAMNNSQALLNLPVMARFFPTTFARMVGSSLSPNEEHEPDFEDEEGELFWPGQSSTGEGLGWVCLMGKAMIKEFGKAYSYRGLDGVVPKPRGPEEDAEGINGQHLSGSTPLGHDSPLPLR